ncbi:hypothetical protein GCG54_00012255 [Colletotrichum gloeosporioides]|uniref:Uncharacterized protein n=1 Tax=Colletotrichum gloeosporioides TaxID=474922 RepID=A0A8H4CJ12_COLGL|nr:uncharacterized protein GCG54_00012255 [Colletotrichum gloeosporioides]KAF3804761.1 hypothetical protein GCG54_00012255 [Colletotrichum gloeosporioides]
MDEQPESQQDHPMELDSLDRIIKTEEVDEPVIFDNLPIIPIDKPQEKIFFFKRMEGSNARFDAMIQVGDGELRPDAVEAGTENALWEVIDGLYLYRQAGLSFKVLQSVGVAEYTSPERSFHRVKHLFSLKTCAFLANRDIHDDMQVLKLALSGNMFDLARPEDENFVVHHARWTKRVKHLAELLGLKMGSPYDGASKKPTEDDVGNWAAGHTEKKLSAYAIYTMMQLHLFGDQKIKRVSMADLKDLKTCLRMKGLAPRFEIHLTREPCGVPHKPGKCVPFVQRLAYLTDIDFTIHHWEDNVILDGTVPARQKKKEMFKKTRADGGDEDTDAENYDSEGEDLDLTLAEQYPDDWEAIVRNGFEEVDPDEHIYPVRAVADTLPDEANSNPLPPLRISDENIRKFGDRVLQFKRPREEVLKPLPATPVTEEEMQLLRDPYLASSQDSTSYFFEGPGPASEPEEHEKRRSKKRREKKERKRQKRRAKSAGATATRPEGMSTQGTSSNQDSDRDDTNELLE